MGSMYGWHCEECGAGDEYYCGGGFLSFNNPEVVELSKSGDYGPAMKALLGNGIPEGWTVFGESVFYLCPNCGDVIPGDTLRIDDGSGCWLTFHTEPEPCPSCGEKLSSWEDKVPMRERELSARCESYFENGCPKCGSKKVNLAVSDCD